MKLAVVAPAPIVTETGTVAPADALSVTDAPPVGAGRERVTVPVAELPPTTETGDTETADNSGGKIVNVPLTELPFNVPVIVAVTEFWTVVVPILNVADVEPDGIVTEAGTVALLVLELRATVMPPRGAGPLRVAVPVADVPPGTVFGEMLILLRVVGVIISVANFATPEIVANILAVVDFDTAVVGILNVVVVAPAAIVTDDGTVALVLLEVRPTSIPPVGAGPLMVTVPVEGVPPATVDGASEMLEREGGVTVIAAV